MSDKYADISGRASRSEFWFFYLFNILLSIVVYLVSLVLVISTGIFEFIYTIYIPTILLIIPGIAVSIRRLHDIGRSGWWLLIGLIPYVGAIILIVFYCLKSDEKNEYGLKPL